MVNLLLLEILYNSQYRKFLMANFSKKNIMAKKIKNTSFRIRIKQDMSIFPSPLLRKCATSLNFCAFFSLQMLAHCATAIKINCHIFVLFLDFFLVSKRANHFLKYKIIMKILKIYSTDQSKVTIFLK